MTPLPGEDNSTTEVWFFLSFYQINAINFDVDDLIMLTHINRHDTIALQPGIHIAYMRLIRPGDIERLSEDYYESGNLVIRVVTVESH